jgi:hypothetical protein
MQLELPLPLFLVDRVEMENMLDNRSDRFNLFRMLMGKSVKRLLKELDLTIDLFDARENDLFLFQNREPFMKRKICLHFTQFEDSLEKALLFL